MSVDLDLIEQSVPLKSQLLEYAMSRRFRKDLKCFMAREIDPDDPPEDGMELINLLDAFILEEPLGDGKTVVDHFVASNAKLTQVGRELLLGWREVVEGVFEVDQVLGDALVAHNLIDDLTYIVYANVGPGAFLDLEPRSFLLMRIVPVRDVWLVSGTMRSVPAGEREVAEKTAASIMLLKPQAVYRNPEKLERAWDVQRRQRAAFIDRYGSDLLVADNAELARVMREFSLFLRFGVFDVRDTPVAGSVIDGFDDPEQGGPRLAEFFSGIYGEGSAAIFFDERYGLRAYRDFGLVDAAFANPTLAGERQYRDAIAYYIRDPNLPAAILQRLVERHPDTANDAIRRALNRTSFAWEKDSERLLRRYKSELLDREPVPMVLALFDAQAVEAGVVPDWFMLNPD